MKKTWLQNFNALVTELTKANLACRAAIEKETGEITIATGDVSETAYSIIYKKANKIGLEEVGPKNKNQTFQVCGYSTIFEEFFTGKSDYIYEIVEFSDKTKELNKAFKKVFSSYKKEATDKSTLKLIKSLEKDLKEILN